MKSNWEAYGFDSAELMRLEAFDIKSDDDTLGLYIEAERRRFYDEFWQYARENGFNPYLF